MNDKAQYALNALYQHGLIPRVKQKRSLYEFLIQVLANYAKQDKVSLYKYYKEEIKPYLNNFDLEQESSLNRELSLDEQSRLDGEVQPLPIRTWILVRGYRRDLDNVIVVEDIHGQFQGQTVAELDQYLEGFTDVNIFAFEAGKPVTETIAFE